MFFVVFVVNTNQFDIRILLRIHKNSLGLA